MEFCIGILTIEFPTGTQLALYRVGLYISLNMTRVTLIIKQDTPATDNRG